MVISSLLVETLSGETGRVVGELGRIAGIETHGTHGRVVVVSLEAESVRASQAIATSLCAMDGVSGVQLVYANFEDDPVIRQRLGRR
ncbi:MAG: chaperone NapD [Coriobacteriales bacterium]|nr:chaperone NapD [Coriobacteriales bacterium]